LNHKKTIYLKKKLFPC